MNEITIVLPLFVGIKSTIVLIVIVSIIFWTWRQLRKMIPENERPPSVLGMLQDSIDEGETK